MAKKADAKFPERQVSNDWRFRAKILSNHDGDTLKAVLLLGMRQTCGETDDPIVVRFAGIDTPEMNDKDPKVRALAVKAQAFVSERLRPGAADAPSVVLYTYKASEKTVFDVYGRLIADVYYATTDKDGTVTWRFLNRELVEAGLARLYDGKAKRSEWVL